MKRTFGVLVLCSVAALAMALTTFNKVFTTTYKVDKSSALGKAMCMTCHVSKKGGKLNPYGTDLQKALAAAKTKKLTAAILKSVESKDSDKDGVKNIDEIKKGTMPGAK